MPNGPSIGGALQLRLVPGRSMAAEDSRSVLSEGGDVLSRLPSTDRLGAPSLSNVPPPFQLLCHHTDVLRISGWNEARQF